MLAYVLALVVVLVAALLAFGIAALLHLQGAVYLVFVGLILVIGIAAAIAIVVMHRRAGKQEMANGEVSNPEATEQLDLALNDANRKLRASQHGARTLEALPLIYILGETDSAKTTTVMVSGLEAELLAGTEPRESERAPTRVLNLWAIRDAALLELGSSIRGDRNLLRRLVQRTQARAYRSAFGAGAAPRAAIVCLNMDQLLLADGGQSLLAAARSTGSQLREISHILGMPVPVYVIVTKLDRVPHFEDYVRNLSEEEVRRACGSTLPHSEASAGTYSDRTSRMLADVLDGLIYKLGEFRVEMLDRESEPHNRAGLYEFPRELGKLRKNLNQYLVELCKPSQLSANPYLRGFFFTGVRARVVERVMAPVAAQVSASPDPGATQYINLSLEQSPAASRTAAPQMISTRLPQWTFLPRLIPEVILGDKSAMAATRQSQPARLFRRILFGSLAVLLAVYIVLLVVSYAHNAALERRIADAAHALPAASASSPAVATAGDLRALDNLRQVVVRLDGYRRNGPPLSYRFGLYQGNRLYPQARSLYFDRFRPLLLNPAQINFVATMRSLPDAPAASSDFNSYLAAYEPLKAYLITTSHPEKSQSSFLSPVFLRSWIGTRQVDADQQQLARAQIDFYANELLRQPPYAISPDMPVVGHARTYLSKFLAETHIYQAMLADAEKTAPAVDFNRLYPDAARYVSDGHVVRGAFTKTGFTIMQEALQHPERYAQAETWVLGEQTGSSFNAADVTRNLTAQYSADFLREWRTFLLSARVAACGNIREAPKQLTALSGPASPILELLFTASHNTAVADPQIRSVFQPTQALVDPNATDRLIGPGNAPYITALSNLSGALDLAAQNPAATADPSVFAPVSQQVAMANGTVEQTAQAFNIDRNTHTEKTVIDLMKTPIDCVARLAPSPGAAANGGGAKMCTAISPLLGRFPFAPGSATQASLQEVDAVFAPDTGAIWMNYNTVLKTYLAQQGAQFTANPAAPQPLNPRFVQYFNHAAHITSVLYSNGQKSPSLAFNLRFLPGNGVTMASLIVDGQRIPAGAASQQFTWNGAGAQRASLFFDGKEVLPYQGTWSLFQLVRVAQITRVTGGYRLDYPINTSTTIAGHAISGTGGGVQTVSFELSGSGADLLAGDGFAGLNCAMPVVK